MADDGNIEFLIDQINNDRLIVHPLKDGLLKNRKGIHFIGTNVPFPILTQNDKRDIEFAITQKVDFIAASMIKSEREIYAIRGLLPDNIKLIAKIEHPQAVKNINGIIAASDMILVARGDLGVELPITVELEVVDTGPDFKGDTATAGTKPARLETGITIQVPMFINNGDTVKVDTRDGHYLERVS